MKGFFVWFGRLGRWTNRRAVERDMDAEMRAHMEMEAEDLVQEGVPAAEARRQARLRFGGTDRFKEEARDAWPLRWAANLAADVRYGLRSLRRTPVYTATAVLALAVGIGANAFVFSFIDAVIFRPLAVHEPERVVAIFGEQGEATVLGFSYPSFEDIRRNGNVFSDVAAFNEGPVSVADSVEAGVEWAAFTSDNYFGMLGIRPERGTVFGPGDLRSPVAVLAHTAWERRFESNAEIIGETIRINGIPFTVIGIMPREFMGTRLLTYPPSVWIPAGMRAQTMPSAGDLLTRRDAASFTVLGRLREGVSVADAQASTQAVARYLTATYPTLYEGLRARIVSNRTPINPWLAPPERFAWIGRISLFGVALVLFIACCNVMNLLLARMTVRRPEIAARVSLGASPARLVQQLLTESTVLAVLGAVASIPVAALAMSGLVHFGPRLDYTMSFRPAVSARVAAYMALLVLCTVIAFGLAPAVRAARRNTMSALRVTSEGRWTRRPRLRELLVAVQVAVSVTVIVICGLLVQSLRNVRALDPGFAISGAVTFVLDTQLLPAYDTAGTRALYARVLSKLAELPGVRSVSRAASVPLDGNGDAIRAFAEGVATEFEAAPVAEYNVVAPSYFETIGTPLLEGREFVAADTAASADVAIINDVLARRLWPSQSALGKRIRLETQSGHLVEVIGVAGSSNYRAVGEAPRAALWRDIDRAPRARTTIVVRAIGDERALLTSVRAAMRDIDPSLPLIGFGTLADRVSLSYAAIQSSGFGALCFALLAAVLAASGVYGVVSYAASLRSREIGIRVALGAGRRDVIRLVLGRVLLMTLAGIAIGLGIAAAVPMGLDAVLHGVSSRDPLTLGVASVVFCLIAGVAAVLPAQRAARMDPMRVLRLD
ncbi:MAG: ADOP family duplicated permease [Longimicrobiales bacterium]